MKLSRIHHSTITSVFGVLLLMLVASSPAHADNKLTFTENHTDKLVCVPYQGYICEAPSDITITISAKLIGSFDSLDANTPFQLTLGNYSKSYTLGDDRKYVSGRSTSATINAGLLGGTIKLKWTQSQLTVTITGKLLHTIFPSGEGWIVAGQYDGNPSGKINDTLSAEVVFSDTDVVFDSVPFSGTIKTKTAHGKDGNNYPLSTISLKGSGTAIVQ